MYVILQPGERVDRAYFSDDDLFSTVSRYESIFSIKDGLAVFDAPSRDSFLFNTFLFYIPKNKISLFLSLRDGAPQAR